MKTLASILGLLLISLPVEAQTGRYYRQPANVAQVQALRQYANAGYQLQWQAHLAQQQQIYLSQTLQSQAMLQQQLLQMGAAYPQYGVVYPQYGVVYPLYGVVYPPYGVIYPQLGVISP